MTVLTRAPGGHRPPLWRDIRVLRVAGQLVFLGLLVALIAYLYGNLVTNLNRQGISTSFGWLDQPAGYAIAGSDFQRSDSYLAAIGVGVANTALVAVVGIILATVIGVVVGVARLSTNWLVRRAAAVYVETLRNVPVLVVILFWWLVVFLRLPPIDRAIEWADVLVLSNRGLAIPWLERTGDLTAFLSVLAVGVIAAGATAVWRTQRFARTGHPHHRLLWASAVVLVAAVLAYGVGGRSLGLSVPERGRFGTESGLLLSPEYAALLFGLTVYTASHIAEIVRGSILAVPSGQTEAAHSLALSGFHRLRYVVLPQALRIMIPPVANQYLNLTKNSSLGVAIAFPEVTRIISLSVGQQAPAPQAFAILMLIYLAFSLATSLLTNLFNWRVSLKGGR